MREKKERGKQDSRQEKQLVVQIARYVSCCGTRSWEENERGVSG